MTTEYFTAEAARRIAEEVDASILHPDEVPFILISEENFTKALNLAATKLLGEPVAEVVQREIDNNYSHNTVYYLEIQENENYELKLGTKLYAIKLEG